MKYLVRRADDAVEFYTDERCHIQEIGNLPDDPDVSIARARVRPGVTTAWHSLSGTAERYLIIVGRGRVEVGTCEPRQVGPGDLVRIPPGVRQRICNTGDGDLLFYAICTPRFRPQCYVALE